MTLYEWLENIKAIKFLIILKEDILDMQIKNNKYNESQSTNDLIDRLKKDLKKLEENLEVILSSESV